MANLTQKEFEEYLDKVRCQLEQVADIADEKKINYGYQFVFKIFEAKATLNIYNGKKGLNLVWQGDSALQERLQQTLMCAPQQKKGISVNHQLKIGTYNVEEQLIKKRGIVWAGSDESGKGDFFGPLVVGAVVLDDAAATKLQAEGVKDCKLLTDKKILELEQKIMELAVDYAVLELKPKFYNLRYRQIAATGGKLNQLLTSGHVEALTKVLSRQPQTASALIDQFTPSNTILHLLKERFPKVNFHQQPKAESDMAVAAASILARARFLRSMEELSRTAGLELPKGGGEHTTACAKVLADKFGKDVLENFVKLHFANYSRI